jgi:hypothetical protein
MVTVCPLTVPVTLTAQAPEVVTVASTVIVPFRAVINPGLIAVTTPTASSKVTALEPFGAARLGVPESNHSGFSARFFELRARAWGRAT